MHLMDVFLFDTVFEVKGLDLVALELPCIQLETPHVLFEHRLQFLCADVTSRREDEIITMHHALVKTVEMISGKPLQRMLRADDGATKGMFAKEQLVEVFKMRSAGLSL